MKQTVEEAAIEEAAIESCVFDKSIYNDEYQPYYLEGFKDGAEWQKNSVWHSPDEKPVASNSILIDCGYGRYRVIHRSATKSWKQLVKGYNIIRWAYIQDLLPTSFDQILEANKDVLQRMKEKGD